MSILEVCQRVSPLLGITAPTAVFASTDQVPLEFQQIVRQVLTDLRTANDWSRLTSVAEVTGDGSQESWPVPADFDRFTKYGQIWRPSRNAPMQQVATVDDWLSLTVPDFQNAVNSYWSLFGDNISFSPVLASGEVIKYAYQKKRGAFSYPDMTPKENFSEDADVSIWDESLLEFGVLWRWKSSKGQDYTEELSGFNERLARAVGSDGGPGQPIVSRRSWTRDGYYRRSMGQNVF